MKNLPKLLPRPVEIRADSGAFELSPETVIFHNCAEALPAARLLAEQLRPATGYLLPVEAGVPRGPSDIALELSQDAPSESEGYLLHVREGGVTLQARSAAGLFYATQTLRQLFPEDVFQPSVVARKWEIPGLFIRDFPRFGWRGMHLDVSRHFRPKEDVLKFIETIASLKFNRFHWHLTDDQGWRIEIKKYPRLTEVGAWRDGTLVGHQGQDPASFAYDGVRHGGFYTQDEVREIVAYAAERHVTILPEIDMPGHMQAAVASYPERGCTGERVTVRGQWGISENVLNTEESTVEFCKDILAEILALFPGDAIHVGGDEVKKREWEASARIQELRRERGLKDMDEMQSWFLRQIQEFLVAKGRHLVGWDEILEGGLDGDLTVMAWRTEERGSVAAKAGHPVVIASRNYYFDYYQAEPVDQEPLAIGGFAPMKKVYAYDPIPLDLTEDERGRVLGGQGQLWTEYMPTMEHVEYMAFPRSCALAESLWLQEPLKDYEDYLRRLPSFLKRLEARGVNYCQCSG